MDSTVLKTQCLSMAVDCFKTGMCDDGKSVVVLAQEFYDFCKGNKSAADGVPEDSNISF